MCFPKQLIDFLCSYLFAREFKVPAAAFCVILCLKNNLKLFSLLKKTSNSETLHRTTLRLFIISAG